MDQGKIRQEITARYARVCTLRDELRVKIHLASMEAKQSFAELERRAERASHGVTEAAARELSEIAQKLEKLAGAIRQGGASAH